MTASYQDQMDEIHKKRLADPLLPGLYKWSRKDDRLQLGLGLGLGQGFQHQHQHPHQQKQRQRQRQRHSSILIEAKNTTFSRCLNGCENCEGSFEINGRRYACRCSHHKPDFYFPAQTA